MRAPTERTIDGMKANNGGDGTGDPACSGGWDGARAATLRIIERHGAQVMRTARRYAATPEDAEDAFQRGIEIMLSKAPDVPDAELLPWLKTVVRHEAFALRRSHDRVNFGLSESFDGMLADEDDVAVRSASPEEQVERFERLRLGAEALRGLKPQEARALSLLAQGYSYSQICEETGWTYTKVNRCLAEGRQKFVQRVVGIESGEECKRLAPKLSALVDGEVSAAGADGLRRHLRGCLACRKTLREQYLAPAAVGALMPFVPGTTLWPFEHGAELVTALKLKASSLVRLCGLDPVALSTSARGVGSVGLAKGFALLCIGGAGVGGAAAGVELIHPERPKHAQAGVVDRPRLSGKDAPLPSEESETFRRLSKVNDDNGSDQPSRSPYAGSAVRATRAIAAPPSDPLPAQSEFSPDAQAGGTPSPPTPRTSSSPGTGPKQGEDDTTRSGDSCSDASSPADQGSRTLSDSQSDDERDSGTSDGGGAGPGDPYEGGVRPEDGYGDGAGPGDSYEGGVWPEDGYGDGAGPCHRP